MNPEHLETRKVFYTRPQDGFSLKSKRNNEEKERFAQPFTPVKSRPSKLKGSVMQGRRLFGGGADENNNLASNQLMLRNDDLSNNNSSALSPADN